MGDNATRQIRAELNSDSFYAELVKSAVSGETALEGLAIASLADSDAVQEGACGDTQIQLARELFGPTPADCKNPASPLGTGINEWVIEVGEEYGVLCGSPDSRQFYMVIEEVKAGLQKGLSAMETLLGDGHAALADKGGNGVILDRNDTHQVGAPDETDMGTDSGTALTQEAMWNLYGLNDSGAATAALQEIVDNGRMLKQFCAAGVDGSWGFLRVPFAPDYVVIARMRDQCPPLEMIKLLRRLGNDVLRHVIDVLLDAPDFSADTTLPESDAEFNKIIGELRELPADDLYNRLVIGGFANVSLGDEGEMEDGDMVLRCRECIYYLPHQRWCDLPELPLPVEADWYCKLWKL